MSGEGRRKLHDEVHGASTNGIVRTRGVILERVRPMRWLWHRRIPAGVPSIIVGEEGIGKGTLAAWIVARATRGELEGDFTGQAVVALVVGDEDGFEPIWVPRLFAAGADLSRVRTLDDGEYIDDLAARAEGLSAAIGRDGIGYVVLDQLLDHVPGGDAGQGVYNPKNVRQALLPLRRVVGEHGIAGTGLLHPIKGNVTSFRQLLAGSHQFNAVSRSSLLLGADPDDEARRVLVRGKGNHSAAPRSFEFNVAGAVVVLNDHTFEIPKAVECGDGDRTIADLLATPGSPVTDELVSKLAPLLTATPQTRAALAKAVDRDPKDGSVGNALKRLEEEKRALRTDQGGWVAATPT
jgi:hypothetical protein